MNQQVKQRIVGGVVIVALLAICIPVFFHGKRNALWRPTSLSARIPAQPQEPQVDLSIPLPTPTKQLVVSNDVAVKKQAVSSLLAPSKPAAQVTASFSNSAAVSSPAVANKSLTKRTQSTVMQSQPAAVKSQGVVSNQVSASLLANLPEAWVVQLASFSNKNNASRLVQQLRQSGYDAYSRANQSGNKALIRVFVGPEINLDKAKSLQKSLHDKFNLQGVVRKYKV